MRPGRSLVASIFLVATISLPSVAGPAPPPTNVLYGFVSTNRTLTLAPPGPFYYVPGDLVIRPGVTLTIEPGVRVAFSTADTLQGGNDAGRVELVVQGQLEAMASYPDSIRLESAGGATALWSGVRSEGAGVVHLQSAVIRGAVTALACTGYGAQVVRNVSISEVDDGIQAGSAPCEIRECRIIGLGFGTGLTMGVNTVVAFPDSTDVHPTTVMGFNQGVFAGSSANVRNLIVRDNSNGVNGFGVINYCTIVRNGRGVDMNSGLVLNSIIALGTYGVFGPNDSVTDYCDIWNNYNGNLMRGFFGLNVASFNPFFLDAANNDFRLGSGSIFLHWSNSGGEIGAYGPGAGLPVAVHRTSWSRVKAMYK